MSESSQQEKTQQSEKKNYRLPHNNTMQHCAKLSIVEDKPIMMDYWVDSVEKTVIIGVRDTDEKLLVRSEEEYTSPISKIYKVEKEYFYDFQNKYYIHILIF